MKRFIRAIYLLRYGVRGAVKPPKNWNRAGSLAYRWHYCMWGLEDRIYTWTGLPDEWWKAVNEPNDGEPCAYQDR
jgi:hypothetical protein